MIWLYDLGAITIIAIVMFLSIRGENNALRSENDLLRELVQRQRAVIHDLQNQGWQAQWQ